MVSRGLGQFLHPGLKGVLLALVFLHLTPYRVFLEALLPRHWSARPSTDPRPPGARPGRTGAWGRVVNWTRRTHLEIVLPGHVGVLMRLAAAIQRRSLLLQRRRRVIVIGGGGSLPVFHLDETGLGGRDRRRFDGRHQWLGR